MKKTKLKKLKRFRVRAEFWTTWDPLSKAKGVPRQLDPKIYYIPAYSSRDATSKATAYAKRDKSPDIFEQFKLSKPKELKW